jgi:hypothetical protein
MLLTTHRGILLRILAQLDQQIGRLDAQLLEALSEEDAHSIVDQFANLESAGESLRRESKPAKKNKAYRGAGGRRSSGAAQIKARHVRISIFGTPIAPAQALCLCHE